MKQFINVGRSGNICRRPENPMFHTDLNCVQCKSTHERRKKKETYLFNIFINLVYIFHMSTFARSLNFSRMLTFSISYLMQFVSGMSGFVCYTLLPVRRVDNFEQQEAI